MTTLPSVGSAVLPSTGAGAFVPTAGDHLTAGMRNNNRPRVTRAPELLPPAHVMHGSYCPARSGDLDGHGAENARPGRENEETGQRAAPGKVGN